MALLRSLLFFYKSHRRRGGKNLRGDSAGRGGPASSGTVKQGETGKRGVRVLTQNGEGQGNAGDGGDGILQTNRGHGIQKTTSEVVINQVGSEMPLIHLIIWVRLHTAGPQIYARQNLKECINNSLWL